jgi:hypothetical protein
MVGAPFHTVRASWSHVLTRVHNQLDSSLSIDLGQLREPQVVTDADPQPPSFCIHNRRALAGCQGQRLLKGDLARNVYVKQVGLPTKRVTWKFEETRGMDALTLVKV